MVRGAVATRLREPKECEGVVSVEGEGEGVGEPARPKVGVGVLAAEGEATLIVALTERVLVGERDNVVVPDEVREGEGVEETVAQGEEDLEEFVSPEGVGRRFVCVGVGFTLPESV